ncbi:hypothetical protein ACEN2J_18675 [Pseudorhodobacter sp. W20_MBD10_FR17]
MTQTVTLPGGSNVEGVAATRLGNEETPRPLVGIAKLFDCSELDIG